MNKIKTFLEDTIYFKILYVMFALFSVVPLISQYSNKFIKLILVYGFVLLGYDLITKRKIFKNKYIWYMIAFVSCIFIATVVNFNHSLVENGKLFLYTTIQFFVLACVDLDMRKSRVRLEIKIMNNMTIVFLTLVSIISVILFLFRINGEYVSLPGTEYENVLYYGVAYGDRLTGIVSNPNGLGMLGLIAIAAMFINNKLFTLSKKIKIFYRIAFGFNLVSLIMSGSRGAELACIVFFLVYLYFIIVKKIKNRDKLILKHIGVIAALCSVMLIFYSLLTPIRKGLGYIPAAIAVVTHVEEETDEDENLFEKYHVNLLRDESESGSNGRAALWQGSINVIKEYPLFGVGKMDVPEITRELNPDLALPGIEGGGMHNILLQTLVSYGIFSLIALIVFIVKLAVDSIKVMYAPDTRITRYLILSAILAAVLMFFANNMFEANILYGTSFMNCFFMLYLGYLMYFLQKDIDDAVEGKPIEKDPKQI